MSGEHEWTRLIEGLRHGDEEVLTEFCERYAGALARIAERNIAPAMRRRFGPETIAQSACCSFLMRAREGRYDVPDSESLWRLLCAITLTKVREKVRFHSRGKRELGREINGGSEEGSGALDSLAATDPDPDEALVIAEELQLLIESLDEEEQKIVELKLLRRSTSEVAEALGCSERTVRRLTGQLRERLEEAFRAA